jgi:hypothetical protein
MSWFRREKPRPLEIPYIQTPEYRTMLAVEQIAGNQDKLLQSHAALEQKVEKMFRNIHDRLELYEGFPESLRLLDARQKGSTDALSVQIEGMHTVISELRVSSVSLAWEIEYTDKYGNEGMYITMAMGEDDARGKWVERHKNCGCKIGEVDHISAVDFSVNNEFPTTYSKTKKAHGRKRA